MKLAIMQPYFFPFLGYFSLLKHTDKWVVFDTPQFIRHGWIERNRILKPDQGWQYVRVPLVNDGSRKAINEKIIRNDEDWQRKIIAQLQHYKKDSPYFNQVMLLLERVFSHATNSIVDLNIKALEEVCKYTGIDFDYTVLSESGLKLGPVNEPDEWALQISLALRATEYYNPVKGMNFFNRQKYENQNIKLHFLQFIPTIYQQPHNNFEPGLSVLDVMMFNSPREINHMLDNYILL